MTAALSEPKLRFLVEAPMTKVSPSWDRASNGASADDDADEVDEVDDGLAEDDEEDEDEDEDDVDVDALLLLPPHALSSATKTMNDAERRAWVRKGDSVSE
jgi:hypothetical protein